MQFRFPGSLSLLPSHFKDHIAGTVSNYPALPPSEWALVHKDGHHLLQSVYWSNWSKLLSITGFALWFAKEAAAQKCWGALTQKLHCSGRINPPFSAVTDYCSEKQVRLLLVHINFCLKKKTKPVLLQSLHRYLLWCLSVAVTLSLLWLAPGMYVKFDRVISLWNSVIWPIDLVC